jgi:outer membrane protein OmpA-like peptidoglycan-associated protein
MQQTKSLVFIAFVLAALCWDKSAAMAQSNAAMQVCADILSQYGITPEGCDFEERTVIQTPEETVVQDTSTQVSPSQTVSQELEENNIFFRKGGDKLDDKALEKLVVLGRVLNTRVLGTSCIRLVGHSDASGPSDGNRQMGLKRANVVAAFLRARVNDPSRISEVESDGEDNLITGIEPEDTLNRRVTIFARRCQQP